MLRATLTLLAGGALAQALPLLLGPLLTRLYAPQEFGAFHLFAAVAGNLAVVACGRYEFALPLARTPAEATLLRRLCGRLLGLAAGLSALGGLGWAWWSGLGWALWLGPAVAVGGALSLATMWATRAGRFQALAVARVLQYGGAALAQAVAGALHGGVLGLVVAPIAAQGLAVLLLWAGGRARPAAPVSAGPPATPAAPVPTLRTTAWQFREFPLLNTPHAFLGALQDTASLALIAATLGPAAAGFWGLALRYLKAPATLVGSAVSQVLYPQLAARGPGPTPAARAAVRRVMGLLGALALLLSIVLAAAGPWLFERLFGAGWREAGELARVLAPYIGAHFVAAPLAVVTMAWGAQAWALRLALWGQAAFVGALALGLHLGGLQGAGRAVSLAMLVYFGWYFWRLATWPCTEPIDPPTAPTPESSP
ncbi:O-antigen/teichoic acid export membrane protein [Sphaerotilus hippei]|uniref:O-antigen/teichoic acid export membrane protein n=1 Tax=Sphaerotilus hippei TaxID=744406 RepID=A0A318GVT6_9BURK|nr:oligosaccharide flippase family protein [Sphaerotilus hippei]PXW93547.1 O-antigen/teichoic acid export membrane protein [Sphaerotilus hippei]